ncbi:MAG: cyclic pyranopterin monophosphate synthase MoaC [Kordiimonadaceae bacterium]|nr:cyclic pyranopterin monophosphate synthase MoaC [Kordiimonadaceae bacterium]MBO6570319.1 cyclic pyranopterin monophosphate synthase MoaC [Kordiimonadaceae bacterium]MBO6965583.1 cyclic pyranopterin monophosphate synthase MoaC [Kordiimonadaceae bacterium]
MTDRLSHTDETGAAHMVDVGAKAETKRVATARAVVHMLKATARLIKENGIQKGDVLAVSRVAGIMAAKKTPDLIPLCHPLPITGASVEFAWISDTELEVIAEVKVSGKTGVEMEALTAVSAAALTVYDMAKAVDKGMTISSVQLVSKEGGKSGTYRRETT